MKNGILKLSSRDFFNGLVMVIGASVVTYLAQALSVPGFDFSSIDYQQVIRIALVAGLTYLGKNFLSDNKGNVLGVKVGNK